MTKNFVLTFVPAVRCEWCERLTTIGIAERDDDNTGPIHLGPICWEHGYVEPGYEGIEAEHASIRRFVLGFYDGHGQAEVIRACPLDEAEQRTDYEVPEDPGFDDKAWLVHYTSEQGLAQTFYVVWSYDYLDFQVYTPQQEESGT